MLPLVRGGGTGFGEEAGGWAACGERLPSAGALSDLDPQLPWQTGGLQRLTDSLSDPCAAPCGSGRDAPGHRQNRPQEVKLLAGVKAGEWHTWASLRGSPPALCRVC